jgi:hypothetical protein
MFYSLIIAIGGIIGLMLLWVLVQALWGRIFSEYVPAGDDVMSGRTKCSNCGCTTACENKELRAES